MLTNGLREAAQRRIELPDMTADCWRALYAYLRGGDVRVESATAVELLQASTPYAPPGFEPTALYSTNSLVTSLLILGSLLLTLLLSTMAFFGNVLKQRSAQNVLRWRRDGAPVLARPLPRPFTNHMASLDFMSFWPIVAPRWAMPTVRRLVTAHFNASTFDEAFAKQYARSHRLETRPPPVTSRDLA